MRSTVARGALTMCSIMLVVSFAIAVAPTTSAITAGANGRLAFASARAGTSSLDIWSMDSDGGAPFQMTSTPTADLHPRWSPDGQRVAFAREAGSSFDIWVADADGSNAVNLTNDAAWDDYPSWSPDGQKLAFSSNRGAEGDFEIWVMNADGSNPVQLTNNLDTDDFAAWSPDGQHIAYMSDALGTGSEIWVMDANGSGPVPLFSTPGADLSPAWSPDSQKIAFASQRDGNWEIYVMDADGTDPQRLTTDAADDTEPAWSPDGQFIAFASKRDGNFEIYTMTATGADQTRITTDPAADNTPDWNIDAGGSPDGTVDAEVTIPSSAACLELSTSSIDFGTLTLGSVDERGNPDINVTNCSGVTATFFARGTDATGSGAAWSLVDSSATCADTLGVDNYHLSLQEGVSGSTALWRLGTANIVVQDVSAGFYAPYWPMIDTACPGSSGGGTTMSMQIVFVATAAE